MHSLERSPTILVVDDDKVFAMTIQRALRKLNLGHTTRLARDGIEALDILQECDVALDTRADTIVLLDLNMPRMNGWELLDQIEKGRTRVPSAIYVFVDDHHVDELANRYGGAITGYINKDVAGEKLSTALSAFTHNDAHNSLRH